jgi:hypothetical protein
MSFRGTTGELLKDLGRQWIDCTREWRCRVAFVLVLIEQEKYPDRAKFYRNLHRAHPPPDLGSCRPKYARLAPESGEPKVEEG